VNARIAALGLALATAATGQVGLGLSPMRVEVNLNAGAVHSGALTLRNEAESPVRIRAELLDFHLDSSAVPQFSRDFPAEAAFSCRRWLSINPMETEIGPHQSVSIRYSLRVPDSAPVAGFHCAAGFNSLPVASQDGKSGLRNAIRMVAAFFVITGNPAVEGELSDVQVEPVKDTPDRPWRAVVTLKNWGKRHFRPNGDLQVLDQAGTVLASHAFPALPVLPNREQRFVFPLDLRPEDKRRTIRVRVGLGAPEIIQEAVVPVEFSPRRE
jgi:hypothetical protein